MYGSSAYNEGSIGSGQTDYSRGPPSIPSYGTAPGQPYGPPQPPPSYGGDPNPPPVLYEGQGGQPPMGGGQPYEEPRGMVGYNTHRSAVYLILLQMYSTSMEVGLATRESTQGDQGWTSMDLEVCNVTLPHL